MSQSIQKKIVGVEVVDPAAAKAEVVALKQKVAMEDIPRPEVLRGSTYKLKCPVLESALYITINDILIEDDGEPYYRPFEIFINSKEMQHYQWIVGLTRVMSAVFRKGGDVTFLVEELSSVFEPSGGYFKKGGKFMPSLVAEIGEVLKMHLITLGMIKSDALSPEQQELVQKKRAEAQAKGVDVEDSGFPANATVCAKCHTKAVVRLDNCDTCLSCAEAKCG